MKIQIHFTGRAELPADAGYEGFAPRGFDLLGTGPGRSVPSIGDRVRLKLEGETAPRTFACVGRVFDLSDPSDPVLRIELNAD